MGILKISAVGTSDVGRVKSINEDSYLYRVVDTGSYYAGVFAVADGVGGLEKGEVASEIAISNINKWWNKEFKTLYENKEEMLKSFVASIKKSNKDIIDLPYKSATTLASMIIYKNSYHLINVGDSRIYKYNGKLQQITVDHSCYIDKIINGVSVKKSVLTECIGHKEDFKYFYSTGEIKKNDIFLICSDGIYKTLEDKELQKIIKYQKNNVDALPEELINRAKSNGEKDNLTAIIVKIGV